MKSTITIDIETYNNNSIGYDMASGPDFTAINGMIIENNADFNVKKMREMLRTAQGRMIANSSFGAYGRMPGKESILKSLTGVDIAGYRKALFDQLYVQTWNPDYYPTDLIQLPQAGSQIASVFPEPSAWRDFIETNRPVDDGVSWLFRKSLVSMAITQVLKS